MVKSIPNAGSLSRFTGVSMSREYPPLVVKMNILFAGLEIGYETILDRFEIGDVLDLVIHYIDSDGQPQEYVSKREIKVI